jgi:hypothetical protein
MDSYLYPKKIDTIDQLKSGFGKSLFSPKNFIFQEMHLNTLMTDMSYILPTQQDAQLIKMMMETP